MNEREIYDAVAEIEQMARARGFKYANCHSSVSAYLNRDKCVRVWISAPGCNVEAERATFAEALADAREQLASTIPDEERLASILGYSEHHQAAE